MTVRTSVAYICTDDSDNIDAESKFLHVFVGTLGGCVFCSLFCSSPLSFARYFLSHAIARSPPLSLPLHLYPSHSRSLFAFSHSHVYFIGPSSISE